MTWWMIVLAVIGYIFIAGVIMGITSTEFEENALYVGFFWPLVLPIVVLLILTYIPYKLGEWIYSKIYDFVHKHEDI